MLELTLVAKPNKLDGITCYEPTNLDCLDKLLTSDLLISNFKNPITRDIIGSEGKQLTKYKNLIDRETGLAKVEYKRVKGMSFGRSNPKGAVGLFQMRGVVRHSFAKRVGMSDWDISNAHPIMLYQICIKNGLSATELGHYINNRKQKLERVMEMLTKHYEKIGFQPKKQKDVRDRAKELFIRLLYFGTFENWLKEKKDKDTNEVIYPEICLYALVGYEDLTEYIANLTTELQTIGNFILNANAKIAKEVDKNKELQKKKCFNRVGSVVSFYLQEYEIRVLECLYDYCVENDYIKDGVCVLSADGIMLKDEWIAEADLPNEFNAVVKAKLGFDLTFENKTLDESLTDEEIENHQISAKNLDGSKFETFDRDYFASLSGYLRKKIYFEIFVNKILRPDPIYIYIEKDYRGYEDICYYTQAKITETFCHLKSGIFDKAGNETKFILEWLADEKIRCYNRLDFIPFNDRDKEKQNAEIFNLFRGFNPNYQFPYDKTKQEKLLKPFKDLGIQLAGGDEEHFNYLLNYLADIVQNPGRKCPIAFIIKGKQGTGKNVWLNAVGNVLGRGHYITSSNPKDFFGDYAEGFYHKLLVNMNECEGKDTFDFEGKIKSFITEDEITLNAKFVRPITIKNLARLIIFTNKTNPIPIDVRSKDRRYVVFETTDHYLQDRYDTRFWTRMVSWFENPEFQGCLYDYLNTRDISNFDFRRKRPITNAYLQMCKLYVPVEVLFLENKINKTIQADEMTKDTEDFENRMLLYKTTGIDGKELYKEYTDYCREFGFYKDATFQKNVKSFYSRLSELNAPLFVKKPQNLTTYYFDGNEVLAYFKERKWIDRSDEDIEEEVKEVVVEGDAFAEEFGL